MRIAIIGGGLAGCAAGYVLNQAGLSPVIYEAGPTLASGASGNAIGLYNPRFTAELTEQGRYYSEAFKLARQTFAPLEDIDWNPCGALHLITDEKKQTRFTKMLKNWRWPSGEMRLVSAAEASGIAGVEITHEALFLPDSGYVSPRKLCQAYAQGVEVRLNTKIEDLKAIEADAIIIANAAAALDFFPDLPLQKIRGQVTHLASKGALENLKTCVCYGGYVTPAHEGEHMAGSTFQRWLDHTDILPEDDTDNLAKMSAAIPALSGDHEITGRRAAIRTASKDQFPVVRELAPGLYCSLAHGSHGIVSSLKAAHILAARL